MAIAMELFESLATSGAGENARALARTSGGSALAPKSALEAENTLHQRLQASRRLTWPTLALRQKAMSEPGVEALLTSASSKAADIHKMTSLEQKRLVLRVKHIRSGSARALTKAHMGATSAAMSVAVVNASRLLSFLGCGMLGSDAAGLEAVGERCAAPLTVPSGIFLRELAHLKSAGAAGENCRRAVDGASQRPDDSAADRSKGRGGQRHQAPRGGGACGSCCWLAHCLHRCAQRHD